MAPITEAIRTEYAYTTHSEVHVYKGQVDPDWTVSYVS